MEFLASLDVSKLLNEKTTFYLSFLLMITGVSTMVSEIIMLLGANLTTGSTAWASSTVLTGYMLGLGAGSLWGSKLSSKPNIHYIFALVQFSISIMLIVGFLIIRLSGAYWLYLPFSDYITFDLVLITVVIAVFIPAFLMGTEIPLGSQMIKNLQPEKDVGQITGTVLALDTVGGTIGCLSVPMFILPIFGLFQAIVFASALNFFISISIIILGDKVDRNCKKPDDDSVS